MSDKREKKRRQMPMVEKLSWSCLLTSRLVSLFTHACVFVWLVRLYIRWMGREPRRRHAHFVLMLDSKISNPTKQQLCKTTNSKLGERENRG
jgi:hypothetical protein